MATQPDPAPDTIEPQTPSEIPSLPGEDQPLYAPDDSPDLAPDFDQPGQAPDEQPTPL